MACLALLMIPPSHWQTQFLLPLILPDLTEKGYEQARQQFTEQELVNLTLAVVAINGWNRFSISFRTVPGTYQPKRH